MGNLYIFEKHNDILNADKVLILGVQVCKRGMAVALFFNEGLIRGRINDRRRYSVLRNQVG